LDSLASRATRALFKRSPCAGSACDHAAPQKQAKNRASAENLDMEEMKEKELKDTKLIVEAARSFASCLCVTFCQNTPYHYAICN
jgi:hypothetical protein